MRTAVYGNGRPWTAFGDPRIRGMAPVSGDWFEFLRSHDGSSASHGRSHIADSSALSRVGAILQKPALPKRMRSWRRVRAFEAELGVIPRAAPLSSLTAHVGASFYAGPVRSW